VDALDGGVRQVHLDIRPGMYGVLKALLIQSDGHIDAVHAHPIQGRKRSGQFCPGDVGQLDTHDEMNSRQVWQGIGAGGCIKGGTGNLHLKFEVFTLYDML
jgi:hypothetical protein